jgi:4'-phosphopantetheinyl transferase
VIYPPALQNGDVHVWRIALDDDHVGASPARLSASAPDERERAGRFRFPRDARRYLAGRAALRAILSGYLGIPPVAIAFTYGTYGKPELADHWTRPRLRFNFAHSEALALLAVTWEAALGVDIERLRPDIEHVTIADRFFSSRERAMLRTLPEHERLPSFFRCWTRKEAYIKARGEGLTMPLADFTVSLAPSEPPALLCVRDKPEEAAKWTICDLSSHPEYAAALARNGSLLSLACFQYVRS